MDQPKKKKRPDPYKRVKYFGYRMSQLPEIYKLNDLVKYAKFQLSVKSGRLMKDPIWDEYTIEELLIEFFAHQFEDSKEFRIKFEQDFNELSGAVDEFAAWADKQIKEESLIRDRLMGEAEDQVRFDPSEIMGDD